MPTATIALETGTPVAELRMARGERGNPIDAALLDELDRACDRVRDDPGVRCLLLTAEGDLFSRGWEGEPPCDTARPLPFRALELLPQPVIACIAGDAIGAGLELALACDLRIAAEGAMFAIPDVAMGMMPALGGTQRLPRLVRRGKAAEMVLLGEPLDAAAALACGLVNAVVPREDVVPHARAIAGRIARQGPLAVRYAKEAVVRGLDLPLEAALRYETDLTVILQTTADRAEGVRAFLEKRSPEFRGE
jgi:enoyl-CoA hydratase/carnithine racemase